MATYEQSVSLVNRYELLAPAAVGADITIPEGCRGIKADNNGLTDGIGFVTLQQELGPELVDFALSATQIVPGRFTMLRVPAATPVAVRVWGIF